MIIDTPFYHSVGDALVDEKTELTITRDKLGLKVTFKCYNNPFVAFNKFHQHNEPLWQQEVLEIFIYSGNETPTRYFEFQINPNNAVFMANVFNPDGTGLQNVLEMINFEDYCIENKVFVSCDDSFWHGSFYLPYSLIGGDEMVYRANIFRVIRKKPISDFEWRCNIDNSVFACWQPTHCAEKPNFHIADAFVAIQF